MYVRPEGWLTVARPLVKIYCVLGNAVAARKGLFARLRTRAPRRERMADGRQWRGRLNRRYGGGSGSQNVDGDMVRVLWSSLC